MIHTGGDKPKVMTIMRMRKCLLPPPLKFLLSVSLAVSLSGCAGWGRWNDNWNNITGGVRDYGQYPMPNEKTCFINPTLGNDIQQGLYNLEFQKAKQGIPGPVLVANYLIPATNQLFVNNNPQPLNALYAQIQPQTLANFMIGCNEVVAQEGKLLIQERQQLLQGRQRIIQDINTLRNQIAQWQNYLNTTPAPQPTLKMFQEYSDTNTHPEIAKAGGAFNNIYESKPTLLFLILCLYTPVDQIDTLLNINTIQGLQNFQQQLQQRHLMTGPPPEPPQINWAKYKLTLTSVMTMKETVPQIEQATQKVYQQLQKIHQQIQKIHQAFGGSHPNSHSVLTNAIMDSPSADLKFWESLPYHGTPGSLGTINWQKALIAEQHGNFEPLIAIHQQMQPQTWRNFFVNYFKWGQKMHMKPIFIYH